MADNTTNIGIMGVDDTYEGVSLSSFLKTLYLNQQAILNEDMTLLATPTTLGSTAAVATDTLTRNVVVTLKDTDGNLLDYNTTFAIAVVATTNGNGDATIEDSASTVTLTGGTGSFNVIYSGTWAAEDTCVVTVTGGTVAGTTVANALSTDTIVA